MPYMLITRPEADAKTTYKQLAAMGISGFIEPMLEINYPQLAIKYNGEKIIVTSGHAIRALDLCTDIPKNSHIIAVGNHTAELAKELGFSDVASSDGDVNKLAEYIKSNYSAKTDRFIYAATAITAGDLLNDLKNAGFKITQTNVYNATPAQKLSEPCITKLTAGEFGGILFYSSRTAEIFASLLKKHNLEQKISDIQAFCLSDNVAEKLHKLEFAEIHSAKHPESEYMLELISKVGFTD